MVVGLNTLSIEKEKRRRMVVVITYSMLVSSMIKYNISQVTNEFVKMSLCD